MATATGAVSLSFVSIFADDIDAEARFYQEVFDLVEVESLRSPHFRGLQLGPTVLGFSARATAYDLLDLPRPEPGAAGVRTFITFEPTQRERVEELVGKAGTAGATLVQEPHGTYYGAWQAVLLDPEGNAFRINYLAELH